MMTSSIFSSLKRSADIALVAGGSRKRWLIATENMQVGDLIKTSGVIGRMAGLCSPFYMSCMLDQNYTAYGLFF